MIKRSLAAVAALAVSLALALSGKSRGERPPVPIRHLTIDLNAPVDALAKDINRAVDDQSRLADWVTAQLGGDLDPDRKAALCYLAGQLHLGGAAHALARQIALKPARFVRDVPSPEPNLKWSRFPAVQALIEIGIPSLPAALDNLRESDDSLTRELSARVIRVVLQSAIGEDERNLNGHALGWLMVGRALMQERDFAKKRRLEAALALFEQPPSAKQPETKKAE